MKIFQSGKLFSDFTKSIPARLISMKIFSERESDIFRSRMPFRRIFRHQSGKWFFPASKSHVASGRSTLRQKNKRP